MKAVVKLVVFLLSVVLGPSSLWASNPAVQITWPGSYGRGSVQLSLTASDGTTSTSYTKTVPYGEYSTAASIASALGAHISMSPEWPVWAKGFPNGSVQMTPRSAVTISNLQVCVVPSGSSGCSSPSGVIIATGDVLPYGPTLVDALYGFVINKPDGSNGYDDAGNIVAYQDLVNQQWGATYDSLNRLKSASQTILSSNGSTFQTPISASGTQQYFCWNYDSFGNRTSQIVSDVTLSDNNTCQLQSSANHSDSVATYDANNRINSGTGMTSINYDAMGNLLDDGHYAYKYDGGGRLCAVLKYVTGLVTGYLYDAEGARVAKGSVSSFDCPTAANFTMTNQYIPGPGDEQMTELDASGNWVHTNIFGNGSLVATDDSAGRHYQLNDWLGNRRMQVDSNGNIETSLQAGPYGDALNPPIPFTTEQYFSGKERDAESGLDYFGARYYISSLGRFTSPDWSADPSAIPYADTGDPQSFNLYSYARNSPFSNSDSAGHDCVYINADGTGWVQRGDCTSDTDNGIFVNGTVDSNSFRYNTSNNSSSFTYTPEGAGPETIGTGVIQGPNIYGGFEPGSLGAAVFGMQNASTWKNSYGVVNAAGTVEAVAGSFVYAPVGMAMAMAGCRSSSGGSCTANMALAIIPFGFAGATAKELKGISGVLKMIDSGTTKGKVFMNLEGKLPAAAEGYYREFTVPLAGQSGRGASRIVTGADGEAYYTADHYETFTRIR